MIYKNIVTGAIIDSPCLISGEDWKELEETITEEVEVEEEEETTEDIEEPKKGKKSNKK